MVREGSAYADGPLSPLSLFALFLGLALVCGHAQSMSMILTTLPSAAPGTQSVKAGRGLIHRDDRARDGHQPFARH